MEPSQLQGASIVVRNLGGTDCQGECHSQENSGAARNLLLQRSDQGDDRTYDQTRDQAANVGGIVDDAVTAKDVWQESPGKIEPDKYKQTSKRT
jgi:hypothetical protein